LIKNNARRLGQSIPDSSSLYFRNRSALFRRTLVNVACKGFSFPGCQKYREQGFPAVYPGGKWGTAKELRRRNETRKCILFIWLSIRVYFKNTAQLHFKLVSFQVFFFTNS